MKKIYIFLILLLTITLQNSFAQPVQINFVQTGKPLACPYTFTRNLQEGFYGEDVLLLQKILNSDTRTKIAESGAGSPGQETGNFGPSTTDAVKRLQQLFPDYSGGIINGVLGSRTRTLVNAICNGSYKVESGQGYNNIQNVQAQANTRDKQMDATSPEVRISTNVKVVKEDEIAKINLETSKEIKPITPDTIDVLGGSIREIRKLSKTSYFFIVQPDDNSKEINIQVEAGKIEDLSGKTNENASNEIRIGILRMVKPGTNPSQANEQDVKNFLDKLIPATLQNTNVPQPNTQQQNQNVQLYNCYGQMIPVTQPCQYDPYRAQAQQQAQQQAAAQRAQAADNQALNGVLSNLLKGIGFGGNRGNPGGDLGTALGGLRGSGGVADLGSVADGVAKKLQASLNQGLTMLPDLMKDFNKNINKIKSEIDKCLNNSASQCAQGIEQVNGVIKKADEEINKLTKEVEECKKGKSNAESCKKAIELFENAKKLKEDAEKLAEKINKEVKDKDEPKGNEGKITKVGIDCKTIFSGNVQKTDSDAFKKGFIAKSYLKKNKEFVFLFYEGLYRSNNNAIVGRCYFTNPSNVQKQDYKCCKNDAKNTGECEETDATKGLKFYTRKSNFPIVFSNGACKELEAKANPNPAKALNPGN